MTQGPDPRRTSVKAFLPSEQRDLSTLCRPVDSFYLIPEARGQRLISITTTTCPFEFLPKTQLIASLECVLSVILLLSEN